MIQMKKTIQIDGKDVVLQTNGLVPLIYKKEFKRDFFADVLTMQSKNMDVEIAYNLLWTFAKCGDDNITELWEWAGQFETLPILSLLPLLTEMVTVCITTKRNNSKKKNKKKTTKNS